MNQHVFWGGLSVFEEIQRDLILLKRGLIITGIALTLTELLCIYLKASRRKKDKLATSRFATRNDIDDCLYDDEDGD